MTDYVMVFPAELWDFIRASGFSWGYLNLRVDHGEGVVTISHVWKGDESPHPVNTSSWQRNHYLRYADITPLSAVWYQAHPDLHRLHRELSQRGSATNTDFFSSLLGSSLVTPGPNGIPVVTVSIEDDGRHAVSTWQVNDEAAWPTRTIVIDQDASPLEFIKEEWPVESLADAHVTLVGVGSIGGAAAQVLCSAGVGHLSLFDPDRLEQRNLARHQLKGEDLGRFKARALRSRLEDRYDVKVDAFCVDIIEAADHLRPVAQASDVILCSADGVAARRVANHVARWARKPLVLAAVFEDGAFGEIIRVRERTGCLWCLRLAQQAEGSLDPEPGLDLGYGTGTAHKPMTAAPPDLQLMGALAAKAAISTILEARGRWEQRLPGDLAIIGLQPKPDMAAPFDIDAAGEVRWHQLPERRLECPTCAAQFV